jgi:hypothetical protein
MGTWTIFLPRLRPGFLTLTRFDQPAPGFSGFKSRRDAQVAFVRARFPEIAAGVSRQLLLRRWRDLQVGGVAKCLREQPEPLRALSRLADAASAALANTRCSCPSATLRDGHAEGCWLQELEVSQTQAITALARLGALEMQQDPAPEN